MSAQAQPHLATDAEPAGPIRIDGRLSSIDILRGLVIILMVLDHVRDFFHASAFTINPLDPETSNPALYMTRWITHLCAPSFVFLAGVSAFLKGARDGDTKSLSWFLFSRGLWLIVLELTVINFGWSFGFGAPFLQVIWAIGISMVLLSALVWLGPRAVLLVGVLIVAGHNLLDPIDPPDLGGAAPAWNLIHEQGLMRGEGWALFVAYPALPWLGVICLGYGLGGLFLKPAAERVRTLLILGAGFIAMFLILRGLNAYGNPTPWTQHADGVSTAMSFFDVQKYPPSLQFVLITLGIGFLLLALFERLRGPLAELFLTYGRVPLFVYVLHIYIAHGLAMATGVAMGRDPNDFVEWIADPSKLQGWGFDLWVVWLVWLLVVAILYLPARWFGAVKRRRKDWWLSYL